MRKKTLRTRIMCALLSLVFLASLFEAPLLPSVEAASSNTATIPITVGGKTFNVTPGQWVTVNTPGGSTSYNVRFVDGKPVALEMSQYQQIIFGEAATSGATTQTGSTGSTSGSSTVSTPSNSGSTNSGASQTSGSTAQTSKPTSSSKPTNSSAAQTSTPASSNGGQMTWNEFQKANAGKGMSGSEMSQAWKDYKASNGTGAGTTNSGAAQTSTNTGSTNTTQAAQTSGNTAQTGNTPAPQTSVAEGAATTGATGTGGTQASSPSSSSSQTSQTTKTWDPAKHPRDPQTGKFISHEEAIARGLMDPADANVSNSSSSQSSQTTQAGEAAQASTADGSTGVAESGASSQSAQAAQASEGTASNGKTKTTIGDKLKSGYQTGKNLTNQGVQNVKDSLKSGFSVKNILVTAGITVGVDLATQIMRGENPSLKTALKTVCSAEFVGGIAGSTLGCAAGSFFTPFLSCIPVVGGLLSALAPTFGSVVGSSVGAYVAGDLKNGRFSIKEAFKRVDWVGVTGQTIGSVVGGALGSCLGPVGGVIGSFAGGMLGNWAAHKIAGLFGKGDANLPTISMPTGTTSSGVGTVSSISLGGSDVTSVTISDAVVPEVEEEQPRESVEASDVDAEITQAYEDYTALYTEYSQLIQAGKTNEAMEVAQKMNEAKAKYDNLRYK